MMKQKLEQKRYFEGVLKGALKDRLESIANEKKRITDQNFNYMRKASKDMGQDMMLDLQHEMNKLKKTVNDLVAMVSAEESYDAGYFKFKD